MMHYKDVEEDLQRAEETIKTALRSKMDTETDKKALGEALELVQQAGEKCRLAQNEFLQENVFGGMRMQ